MVHVKIIMAGRFLARATASMPVALDIFFPMSMPSVAQPKTMCVSPNQASFTDDSSNSSAWLLRLLALFLLGLIHLRALRGDRGARIPVKFATLDLAFRGATPPGRSPPQYIISGTKSLDLERDWRNPSKTAFAKPQVLIVAKCAAF